MLSSAKRRPWRSFPSSDTRPINHGGEDRALDLRSMFTAEKREHRSRCHPSRLAWPPELRLQRLHLSQQIAAFPHQSTQVVECSQKYCVAVVVAIRSRVIRS